MTTRTAPELAAEWRCSTRKVSDAARQHGLGVNLGGRAGWRFTPVEAAALWEAMRPKVEIVRRKRRRTS